MPTSTWCPPRERLDEPLYLGLANALADDIARGRLVAGDRLPTQRELSAALGLSLGTITRAFQEAGQRGLIRGEIGRGTFVAGGALLPAAGTEPHDPSSIVDLSVNHPLYGEDPSLASALEQLAKRRALQRCLQYHPPAGLPEHRAIGARWIGEWGFEASPDAVMVCAGAQNAIAVALASLAAPGDRILTDALTYPGVKAVASMLHLDLQGVDMDEEGMRPRALEAAAGARPARVLYVVPTIQNPTCGVMSLDRRRELAGIARAHDLAILEDDVHRPLVPEAPPPICSFAPERGYFVASLAKVLAGGLRVAFLAAPPDQVERVSQSIWATSWMASPLSVEIAGLWLEDGTAAQTLARKRAEMMTRQALLASRLAGHPLRAHPCGYHAWLPLPGRRTGADLAVAARRAGVLVTPGSVFAIDPAAPIANGIRVSLGAAPDRDALTLGIDRLARVLAGPRALGPALV